MLKELEKPPLKLKNFKATEKELSDIQKRADKYAKGNFSAYVRYCALNYRPAKDELKEKK